MSDVDNTKPEPLSASVEGWVLVPRAFLDQIRTMLARFDPDREGEGSFYADQIETVLAAPSVPDPGSAGLTTAPYGIIDPDYARVFTIARCIAWSEGYALLMHGSFTRDLDMLAVPWDEKATEPEHLVKRITLALDDLSLLVKDPAALSQASEKPHGRLSWTFTFKTFGDPRFVDLGVMPRALAPVLAPTRTENNDV